MYRCVCGFRMAPCIHCAINYIINQLFGNQIFYLTCKASLGGYSSYLISYVSFISDHFLFAEEDECQPNPCLNGGRCIAHFFGGGFDCECPLGFRGTTCRGRL